MPIYRCFQCLNSSPKKLDYCPKCHSWSGYRQIQEIEAPSIEEAAFLDPSRSMFPSGHDALSSPVVSIVDIPHSTTNRMVMGGLMTEVDRVFGGGIVKGSAILLAGSPGCGKSTLAIQIAHSIASHGDRAYYLSGEESREQARVRAGRVGALHPNLLVMAEIEVNKVLELLEAHDVDLLVIDSIQSIYDEGINGSAGSSTQVKAVGAKIVRFCKQRSIPVILIGHVTKDNTIAGPRILEHLVDTILYLDGDNNTSEYRILRANKNRFGPSSEAAVFRMEGEGLRSVPDPTTAFLPQGSISAGSVLTVILEGTKPLIVEIQALVSPEIAKGKRKTIGIDSDRLTIIEAVLSRAGFTLGKRDLFLSVSGGISIAHKPEADLAIAIAILSSAADCVPSQERVVAYGEIVLSGEVREARNHDICKDIATKYGFPHVWSASPKGDVVIRNLQTLVEKIYVEDWSD